MSKQLKKAIKRLGKAVDALDLYTGAQHENGMAKCNDLCDLVHAAVMAWSDVQNELPMSGKRIDYDDLEVGMVIRVVDDSPSCKVTWEGEVTEIHNNGGRSNYISVGGDSGWSLDREELERSFVKIYKL